MPKGPVSTGTRPISAPGSPASARETLITETSSVPPLAAKMKPPCRGLTATPLVLG
jgi:hypothetical protein